jgi:hypothetical protein
VRHPKIAEVAPSTECARLDVLNRGACAGTRVETHWPSADQAFADPIAVLALERAVRGGDLIQQSDD